MPLESHVLLRISPRKRSKLELKKCRKIQPNISFEEHRARQAYKTDHPKKILPANKENATVILDTET